MGGFAWLGSDGSHWTTRQSATVKTKGPYFVRRGEPVMAALVVGWLVEFQEKFSAEGDADGLLRAGVGWDSYLLCPSRALEMFAAAAELSNPVGAYNAALMRLERGEEGDRARAIELLTLASGLGDKKSSLLLSHLGEK